MGRGIRHFFDFRVQADRTGTRARLARAGAGNGADLRHGEFDRRLGSAEIGGLVGGGVEQVLGRGRQRTQRRVGAGVDRDGVGLRLVQRDLDGLPGIGRAPSAANPGEAHARPPPGWRATGPAQRQQRREAGGGREFA